MFRYLCTNPDCLNTFTLPHLKTYLRCDLCGDTLLHAGKEDAEPYPPKETIEELKSNYARLKRKALNEGLTDREFRTIGRAYRKIDFEARKELTKGILEEGVIYKHVKTENGLWKMVVDKSAMYYRNRKRKNEKQKL